MRETPVQSANVVDALRLNDRELAAITARLPDRESDAPGKVRRNSGTGRDDLPRMLVRICHQRGACTTYLVKPRDVHEHGIVFLHGSYVHDGAVCFVILRDREGRPTQLSATVFRCRHISGRVHELVAVFDRPIRVDEYQFADGAPLPARGSGHESTASVPNAGARH
jgi:hypothetical protein